MEEIKKIQVEVSKVAGNKAKLAEMIFWEKMQWYSSLWAQ